MTTQPRTGVFLVRVWREEGQFRARVTWSLDIESDLEMRIVTAHTADVQRRLATWLADFEQAAE
jgi:hypothetical protein